MNTPGKNQDMGWERGEKETPNTNEEPYIGTNKDASGDDVTEQAREDRTFHQAHGNRKYKSFTNHSSADDQPMVNTGPGNV